MAYLKVAASAQAAIDKRLCAATYNEYLTTTTDAGRDV